MVGNPKFNYGDTVKFKIVMHEDGVEKEKIGTVSIIDRYGTFFDDSDVSYDILVDNNEEKCLYKHIREDALSKA